MTLLSIDTSNNKEVTIGLTLDDKKDSMTEMVGPSRSQLVLPLIKKTLEKHALSLKDLTAIQVITGPGSFTGLRVGVTIANTLGLLLHIPINDNPVGVAVEPSYS